MDNKQQENQENQPIVEEIKQPDETGGFYLQGHVKIFDPESKEVYFKGRA